jgi:hypothetical protein
MARHKDGPHGALPALAQHKQDGHDSQQHQSYQASEHEQFDHGDTALAISAR